MFAVADDVVVLGRDDAALLAAAEAYAARAPYIWRPSGEKIAAIGRACDPGAQISGITYMKGKAGINRAFINCTSDVTQSRLEEALNVAGARECSRIGCDGERRDCFRGALRRAAGYSAAPPAAGAGRHRMRQRAADGEGAGPARLDLATLYTMRGLFRGTPRMPIPSNLDGQLYVPAGAAGIAMANLAARMGLETTGITLPLATPASTATAREVRPSPWWRRLGTRQGSRTQAAGRGHGGQERARAFAGRRRAAHRRQGVWKAARGAGARR